MQAAERQKQNEFAGETKTIRWIMNDITLHRIRAAGEYGSILGGLVELVCRTAAEATGMQIGGPDEQLGIWNEEKRLQAVRDPLQAGAAWAGSRGGKNEN